MARALAAEGVKLVVGDNDPAALAQADKALRSEGATLLTVELDVALPHAWELAADNAEATFGPVHILCNNAGVGLGRRRLTEISPADWDWVLRVNVGGVFNGLQTFVRRMHAHGEEGHIVNTASILGLFATPLLSAYVASKFAVVGLSESVRLELAETNIGLSVLCPGIVQTPFAANSLKYQPSAQAECLHPSPLSHVEGRPAGMDADAIGRMVVEAIREKRFYILTHPEYRPVVTARMDSLAAEFCGSADPAYQENIEFLGKGAMAFVGSAAAGP